MTIPAGFVDVPKASALIITNTWMERFALQRKDDTHPTIACRGLIALFGGRSEPGESADRTLVRELEEEIANKKITDALIRAARFFWSRRVPFRVWEGCYDLTVYIAALSDAEFGYAEREMQTGVKEGCAQFLARGDLAQTLSEPTQFFASQDLPLRKLLTNTF